MKRRLNAIVQDADRIVRELNDLAIDPAVLRRRVRQIQDAARAAEAAPYRLIEQRYARRVMAAAVREAEQHQRLDPNPRDGNDHFRALWEIVHRATLKSYVTPEAAKIDRAGLGSRFHPNPNPKKGRK